MELDINLVIQLYDKKIAELTHQLILKEAENIQLQQELQKKGSDK